MQRSVKKEKFRENLYNEQKGTKSNARKMDIIDKICFMVLTYTTCRYIY